MKLAVLSDVHGNLVALDAVLRDIEGEKVNGFAALGDMIQGGAQPSETVQRLRDLACPIVMGNSDAWLLTGQETGSEAIDPERLRRHHVVREWALSRLSENDREFIASFTPTIHVPLEGGLEFMGFHGSPRDFDEFIFPTTPDEEFHNLLMPYSDRILAGGHIHLPHLRRIRESFFFNPGSVGVAYNHAQEEEGFRFDPWAEYAILSVDGGRVGLEFRRVPVDFDELSQAYRESGRPFAEDDLAMRRPRTYAG